MRVRIQYGLRRSDDTRVIAVPNVPEFVDVTSMQDAIDNLSQSGFPSKLGFGLVLCEVHLTEVPEADVLPESIKLPTVA